MTTNATLDRRAILILSMEEQAMVAAYVENEIQMPFGLVSSLTGLDAELLRKLVRDGILEGIAPLRSGAGTCNIDQAREIANRLDAARRPVEGQGILATTAAKKYSFPDKSIYNWHYAGWIRVVAVEDGNRLFNEGDIAFARELANIIGSKPGKAVFPYRKPTGRPPKKPI